MDNIILIAVIVAVVGLAVFYVYKAKRGGKKCIGCPESGNGCCSCNCSEK